MGGGVVKVFGVTMVKDELDILPYTLPRMMKQLDHIIVADNMSTDGTYEWLIDFAADNDITLIRDEDPAYTQSAKMSKLAEMAREMGADWVVPFDADEVWYHPYGLKPVISQVDSHVVQCALYDHVATGWDIEAEEDTVARMAWRRIEPLPLPKVAARALPGLVIEQGNHGARYPGPHTSEWSGIVVHHFPYRSAEQMARKAINGAAAYRHAEGRVPPGAGAHWREYDMWYERGGIDAIREIFDTWFYSADPSLDELLEFHPCLAPC